MDVFRVIIIIISLLFLVILAYAFYEYLKKTSPRVIKNTFAQLILGFSLFTSPTWILVVSGIMDNYSFLYIVIWGIWAGLAFWAHNFIKKDIKEEEKELILQKLESKIASLKDASGQFDDDFETWSDITGKTGKLTEEDQAAFKKYRENLYTTLQKKFDVLLENLY